MHLRSNVCQGTAFGLWSRAMCLLIPHDVKPDERNGSRSSEVIHELSPQQRVCVLKAGAASTAAQYFLQRETTQNNRHSTVRIDFSKKSPQKSRPLWSHRCVGLRAVVRICEPRVHRSPAQTRAHTLACARALPLSTTACKQQMILFFSSTLVSTFDGHNHPSSLLSPLASMFECCVCACWRGWLGLHLRGRTHNQHASPSCGHALTRMLDTRPVTHTCSAGVAQTTCGFVLAFRVSCSGTQSPPSLHTVCTRHTRHLTSLALTPASTVWPICGSTSTVLQIITFTFLVVHTTFTLTQHLPRLFFTFRLWQGAAVLRAHLWWARFGVLGVQASVT
jgi:hypothetical protein